MDALVATAILGIALGRASPRPWQGTGGGGGGSQGCGHGHDPRGQSLPLPGSAGLSEGSRLLMSRPSCSGKGVQPTTW